MRVPRTLERLAIAIEIQRGAAYAFDADRVTDAMRADTLYSSIAAIVEIRAGDACPVALVTELAGFDGGGAAAFAASAGFNRHGRTSRPRRSRAPTCLR